MASKQTLSKKSQALIDTFLQAAETCGLERECGSDPKHIDKTEKACKAAKAAVEAHVLRLERRVKKLQADLKAMS